MCILRSIETFGIRYRTCLALHVKSPGVPVFLLQILNESFDVSSNEIVSSTMEMCFFFVYRYISFRNRIDYQCIVLFSSIVSKSYRLLIVCLSVSYRKSYRLSIKKIIGIVSKIVSTINSLSVSYRKSYRLSIVCLSVSYRKSYRLSIVCLSVSYRKSYRLSIIYLSVSYRKSYRLSIVCLSVSYRKSYRLSIIYLSVSYQNRIDYQ